MFIWRKRMEKNILSLKNIYRFLVINDYPIYSTGIISEKNRKGLTLVRFWQDNLLYEFRNRKYGRVLWRNTGSRNRYLSEICNRSDRLNFYREYTQEIIAAAQPQTVLSQIRLFVACLQERQFSYEVFVKKLEAMLTCFEEGDSCYTEEIGKFFREPVAVKEEMEMEGIQGQSFFAAWYLTFLALHAMTGECMGTSEMKRLRMQDDLKMTALWAAYRSRTEKKDTPVRFLTRGNCEICTTPLPGKKFFGREEELFDLRERLEKGGRYLISGIGGIGKTELMRQLLQYCCEEHLADDVAVIQYESSLAESFIRAFDQYNGGDLESNFCQALAQIRKCQGRRVLIFIDNMDRAAEQDSGMEDLLSLPATIFVTSRQPELKGFEIYPVKAPSQAAGMLIFRDNYEKVLTAEDRRSLQEILNGGVWCHTLTLRLLGRAAKARKWSVQELKDRLEANGVCFSWTEGENVVRLQQIYREMYSLSRLKKSQKKLLRAFSVLPYGSYSREFADQFLGGFVESGEDMEKKLAGLWECGWLEKNGTGYSMHPFIAECIRSKVPRENEFGSLFEALWEEMEKESQRLNHRSLLEARYTNNMEVDRHQAELAKIALVSARCLEGPVSGRLMRRLLLIASISVETSGDEDILPVLKDMMHRCRELDDEMRVLYCIIESEVSSEEQSLIEKEFQAQKNRRTIEEQQYYYLGLVYGKRLTELGKNEQALEIMEQILASNSGDDLKMMALNFMGELKKARGEYEEALDCFLHQYELAERIGNKNYIGSALHAVSAQYMGMKRFDEAWQWLERLGRMIRQEEEKFPRLELMYYIVYGGLLMGTGDSESAVPYFEKGKEASELYYGRNKKRDYVIVCRELAIALSRVGRREEALQNYQEVLEFFKGTQAEFQLSVTNNNIGVLYLEWGKPEEALSYLEEAYRLVKQYTGIPVAEPAYNLARVYRQLGNTEQELAYLQLAAPLLEEGYGTENPKASAARTRLEELSAIGKLEEQG